jgi:2-C-methyl-D-erythritol 4-phosphate cytidylyltransferase
MKKFAVIAAGGSGSRMGMTVPKQFLPVHGKPVLWYSISAFLKAFEDIGIILVLPPESMEEGRTIAASTTAPASIQLVGGGKTRFQSVKNGLALIQEPSVVFVHDAARCLLTTALIHRCYKTAIQFGSAIPVIDSSDSARLVTAEGNQRIDRSRLKLVQTPQTFLSDLLLPAFQAEYSESFTDEASVLEASGHSVQLVEGELNNIKITRPADLAIVDALLDFPENNS